jgi:hypothetical protein
LTAKRRTRSQLVIRADNTTLPYSGIVAGPARAIQPRLRDLGIPSQYDERRHAFKVPKERLDDLLCALELDGHRVDVQMASWS